MIEMTDIVKKYEMSAETVYALDGVTLNIDKGEFVAIVGPSGSGKSTLMNIIGCLDVADSGTYVLNEKPIGNYSERQLARIRNENIGFVFQGFNLLSKLSAIENVELPLIYKSGSTERRKRAKAALESVGLGDRITHKPNELSGGQQQRVALARALIADPALILADEPTGNLDQKTSKEILSLFEELNKAGHTIVLITHDTSVAARAHRRIYIVDGKIVEKEESYADSIT